MQLELLTKEEFHQWAEQFLERVCTIIRDPEKIGHNAKLYNTKEASTYLKVCQKTLQNYRDDGLIKFSQINRKITFTQSDLDDFIKNYHKELFNKNVVVLKTKF